MSELLWIPLLVAAAVGLLAYPTLARLSALPWPGQGSKGPQDRMTQLGEFLAAVPLPMLIVTQWADQKARTRAVRAGLPWSARAMAAARWLSLWIGALLALAFLLLRGGDLLGWFIAIVMLGLGWKGAELWVRVRVDRRRQQIDRALPDFLDRLTLGLEAGLGFEVALRRTAARFGSLLGEELRRAVRSLDRGHPKSEVLDELVARGTSTDLRAFAASVKQSELLGTPLTKTLRVQSDLLRSRRRRRAEEASRRLPILIVFPLVFFFLPALLIVYLGPPLLHLFLGG